MDKKHLPSPTDGPLDGPSEGEPRRDFMTKAAALATGGVISACPLVAGVAVFLDPLRRSAQGGQVIRVAALAALPADGEPRQFPVIVESRDDAWSRFHHEPVGAVFLRRMPGKDTVQAINATCPHAGCFVAFDQAAKEYKCPCHTSAFDIDGQPISGPSPRALDELKCEVVGTGDAREILVKFQEYYTGIAEQKPKS